MGTGRRADCGPRSASGEQPLLPGLFIRGVVPLFIVERCWSAAPFPVNSRGSAGLHITGIDPHFRATEQGHVALPVKGAIPATVNVKMECLSDCQIATFNVINWKKSYHNYLLAHNVSFELFKRCIV